MFIVRELDLSGVIIHIFVGSVSCILFRGMNLNALVSYACRCVDQINKMNRGDISAEDLKEKQVSTIFQFGDTYNSSWR
jgi:hypothetical protein